MTLFDLIIKEIYIEEIDKQEYYRLLANNRILETSSFIEEIIFKAIKHNAENDELGNIEEFSYLLNLDIKTFNSKIYKYKNCYILIKD